MGICTSIFTYYRYLPHIPGARLYHSTASVWLSADPLSDKYPGVSPYAYCGDNPVRLVDKDGRSWEIDGISYTPGGTCPNECSESTKYKWETMNRIYATSNGHSVIDEMDAASDVFNIVSVDIDNGPSGYYRPNKNSSGGTIVLNCNDFNLATLSHEMFHGYQDLYGQGGRSIANEIEANLFAYSVTSAAGERNSQANIFAMTSDATSWDDCLHTYNRQVNSLYFSPSFNDDAFNYVKDEFYSYSRKNWREAYNSYPLQRANQDNRLIPKFYPL